MLRHVVAFELRYWLRSWLLWTCVLAVALLIMAGASSDKITIGIRITNTLRNAPYVVQNYYGMIAFFALLMSTAFVNAAAGRDFTYNTHQVIFATPLRRRDFILGRYLGATFVSVLPMLGVSLGMLLAKHVWWADAERFGAVHWAAHRDGILVFALPNAFVVAAVMFAVAVLTRSEVFAFSSGVGFLVAYTIAETLVQGNLEHERLAALLDPFGYRTFALATKYWTVAEKNSLSVGLSGLLLWNRVLWLGVGALALVVAYRRFSFSERHTPGRRGPAEAPFVPRPAVPEPELRAAPWAMLIASTRVQFLGVVKSVGFLVVLGLAVLNTAASLLSHTEMFGLSTFLVSYQVLRIIDGSMYLFVIGLIMFYAGVLVWRDRELRMDEINDALATPAWLAPASRLCALVGVVLLIQCVALACGLGAQLWEGYHRHQFGLLLSQLFVRDASFLVFLAVLAVAIQTVVPNRHLGSVLFVVFLLANFLAWGPLNVASRLVRFARPPTVVYSDFFQDLPYRAAWGWFTLYWALGCGLLVAASVAFWPRGKATRVGERVRIARLRFHGGLRAATAGIALAFVATGVWIAYNTKVVNALRGPKDLDRLAADFEKAFKPFAARSFPRLRAVQYAIDLRPETRNMSLRAEAVVENASGAPQEEIHFTVARDYETRIDVPGAALVKDDARLDYRVYRFDPPLQPGETRTLRYTVKSRTRGFENDVTQPELVQNGTFFNNLVAPRIGYDPERELTDPNDRRDQGLGEQVLMPPLERECGAACGDTFLGGSADWVDVRTVISTSPDQIAIAPGSLRREWQQDGRRFFEYQLDHASLNLYAFISARYQVAREAWGDVQLEVYHLPEHAWNVPRMLRSMQRSLEYYSREFGPYAHKQARILEFPRVATFAQSFPGTMPYSESIGFIANPEHPDDIDMVFYVVAHEMAHQWWGHQVVGAHMQGATLLVETLSQYSALMVMEQEYGRDMMRKFLRYEMDRYLVGRGRERLKERPLLQVESEQGYVHYNKGSVVMYALKEAIGEDAVNRALRSLVARYAYAAPPYPTSWDLVDALRKETPPEWQHMLKDMFEGITLFSNRTLEATSHPLPDGKYEVTISVETRKYNADAKGHETEVPLDDWIEVGAFAKPDKGRKYGRTLHRERVHLTEARSTRTFVVAEAPDRAGVDPFLLLIDRVPDDNVMSVTPVLPPRGSPGGTGRAGL